MKMILTGLGYMRWLLFMVWFFCLADGPWIKRIKALFVCSLSLFGLASLGMTSNESDRSM